MSFCQGTGLKSEEEAKSEGAKCPWTNFIFETFLFFISRAIAPLACGSIYAWSIVQDYGYPIDVNLMFIIFGLVYMAAVIFNLFIPERLNKQRKKRKRMEPTDDTKAIQQPGLKRNQADSKSSPCAVEKHDGLRGIEIVFEEECPDEDAETQRERH